MYRVYTCNVCSWTIDAAQANYSNYFKLHCTDFLEGSVVLVEQLDSIVLYCESRDDYIYARNAVEEAVSVAMSKHKLSPQDKPRRAFYCPCKEGGRHARSYSKVVCKRASLFHQVYSWSPKS